MRTEGRGDGQRLLHWNDEAQERWRARCTGCSRRSFQEAVRCGREYTAVPRIGCAGGRFRIRSASAVVALLLMGSALNLAVAQGQKWQRAMAEGSRKLESGDYAAA